MVEHDGDYIKVSIFLESTIYNISQKDRNKTDDCIDWMNEKLGFIWHDVSVKDFKEDTKVPWCWEFKDLPSGLKLVFWFRDKNMALKFKLVCG